MDASDPDASGDGIRRRSARYGGGVTRSHRPLPTLLALWLLALLCGCAELRFRDASFDEPFRFEEDSFAFANDLI